MTLVVPSPIRIAIPPRALVLLVGPSGSGKSTFARRHFRASEILSSDAFRELVADDENDQGATRDAFQVLHLVASARLRRGRVTVVDATNLRRSAREPLLRLAATRRRPVVAIAFDLPAAVFAHRNAARTDRHLPHGAMLQQRRLFASAMRDLPAEDLAMLVVLGSVEAVDRAQVERVEVTTPAAGRSKAGPASGERGGHDGRDREDSRLSNGRPRDTAVDDRRDDHGLFDVGRDVHGCTDELLERRYPGGEPA